MTTGEKRIRSRRWSTWACAEGAVDVPAKPAESVNDKQFNDVGIHVVEATCRT